MLPIIKVFKARFIGCFACLFCLCGLSSHASVTIIFSYDSLNRVTNIAYSTGFSLSYGYDKAGNRTLLAVQAPNHPPVPGRDFFSTRQNQIIIIPVERFLLNDTDPDGDPLNISAVISPSTNGASVFLEAGFLTYTPANNFAGDDLFTYTIRDPHGGSSSGLVIVNVQSTNSPALTPPSIIITESGKRIRFFGIPGQTYMLQSAQFVDGPWSNISDTLVATSNGAIDYEDNEQPEPSTRFYRLISLR